MSNSLPATNSDGLPIVPMTQEQLYAFDLKGWLCVPAVISPEEAAECSKFMYQMRDKPESLQPFERNGYAGPLERLLDHPVVVGILNELIATTYAGGSNVLATEESYGFRLENNFTTIRTPAFDAWGPHGGGGFFNFSQNSHIYQMHPGRIHSGLTRVVWEFHEVGPGDCPTMLLSGSHKSAFPTPPSAKERDCKLYETYTCPPGSILVFTEALCHTGTRWQNKTRDRCSSFYCYNDVGSKWHHGGPPAELIEKMPKKRQSLFRGVWNGFGPETNNHTYTPTNRAI